MTTPESNTFRPPCGRVTAAVETWRRRLYDRLAGKSTPVFVFERQTLPAAALWNLSKLYTKWLREHRIGRGDRVVLDLAESPAFLATLIACLREGCTVAIPPMSAIGDSIETLSSRYDARIVITRRDGKHAASPDASGLPPTGPLEVRAALGEPTPNALFLLSTSGTQNAPKHIALSAEGVLSVLDSHQPKLDLTGRVAASILPWRHAFGLVIDLLAQIFAADEIVRSPDGGRDVGRLADLCIKHKVDWLSAVPLSVERLLGEPDGEAAIDSLQGGVIGGAPVWPSLAKQLAETRLQVGYGQTEASPGLCLGEPGKWRPGLIGHAVGCATAIDRQGVLWFAGKNACVGEWRDGELSQLSVPRWVRTGDLVQPSEDGLVYVGRIDDRFKLANGRWIAAGWLETQLMDRLPDLARVAVLSSDSKRIDVVYQTNAANLDRATADVVSRLGLPFGGAHRTATAGWPVTPKGAVDRDALATKLSDSTKLALAQ